MLRNKVLREDPTNKPWYVVDSGVALTPKLLRGSRVCIKRIR